MYFVYSISSPTFIQLAALSYFVLQQYPFSFLQCRSKMRKDFGKNLNFFQLATPASLSCIIRLCLSKQSGVTARTNIILVPGFQFYLPRKGFLLRSMFSAKKVEFLSRANKITHCIFHVYASLHSQKTHGIELIYMLSILNRGRVTNNMQI